MADKKNINQTGFLSKMPIKLEDNAIIYNLQLNSENIILNDYLGKKITIEFLNKISCVHCKREIKKSFNSGYCFPCFRKLAECDSCIMSPEKCHYHLGTCRDPKWGEDHCMQSHYVYLANTSGVKVGITRGKNIPTRWIDQGAISALPIFKVSKRYYAGLIEVIIKNHLNDKTHWQKMLSNAAEDINLESVRNDLYPEIKQELDALILELEKKFPNNFNNSEEQEIKFLNNNEFEVLKLSYPVLEYPSKVKSFNLDKNPIISGTLMGIKAQYLIFDNGVINIRKFAGYNVKIIFGEE